jgi:amino acid permease
LLDETKVTPIYLVQKSTSLAIARLLFSGLAALTYPLQLHPCRASIDNCLLFFLPNTPKVHGDVSFIGFLEFLGHDVGRRSALTLFLMSLSYATAIKIEGIENALLFVGATGGMLVNFILPSIFYLTLHPAQRRTLLYYTSLSLIVFGCIFGLVQTFMKSSP